MNYLELFLFLVLKLTLSLKTLRSGQIGQHHRGGMHKSAGGQPLATAAQFGS